MIQLISNGNYLEILKDGKGIPRSKNLIEFQRQGSGKYNVVVSQTIIHSNIPYSGFSLDGITPFASALDFETFAFANSGFNPATTDSVAEVAENLSELDADAEKIANKGEANGYTPLNGSIKVDPDYLPSYVDDVIEFANVAAFPGTGETGKIYIALDTNLVYRWGGSGYFEIANKTNFIQLANTGLLPETGEVTVLYYVSSNKTFYTWNGSGYTINQIIENHSQLNLDDGTNPHGTTKEDVGLANADNTSDADKPLSDLAIVHFAKKLEVSGHYSIKNTLTTTSRYCPIAASGQYSGVNANANVLYVSPFIMEEQDTVADIAAEVTTLGVLATFYIGIYELDADKLPTGTPVVVSTGLSGTTTGLKTFAVSPSYTLLKNKWYGLAILSDVTVGVRGILTRPILGGSGSNQYGAYTHTVSPGFTTLPTSPVMNGKNLNSYSPATIQILR